MRASVVLALLGIACGTAAKAESGPHGFQIHGSASGVSDFRYRGVSQSAGQPALQGNLTLDAPAGLYADVFASTIASYGGAHQEVDVTLGRRMQVAGLDLDLSASRYSYPAAHRLDYWEFPITLSRTTGPWTWTGGAAYAPPQVGTDHRANWYAYVRTDWHRLESPFTLTASLGRETGAFAEEKIDWLVGGRARIRAATLSLSYLGYSSTIRESRFVASAGVEF